jgi:hypothetical protein
VCTRAILEGPSCLCLDRRWRDDVVLTFLERDIRKFGVEVRRRSRSAHGSGPASSTGAEAPGATPAGTELDLLVFVRGRRFGFEVKYSDEPRTTRSMAIATQDLGLDGLLVVYPGETSYAVREGIDVVAIRDLDDRLDGLVHGRRRGPSR